MLNIHYMSSWDNDITDFIYLVLMKDFLTKVTTLNKVCFLVWQLSFMKLNSLCIHNVPFLFYRAHLCILSALYCRMWIIYWKCSVQYLVFSYMEDIWHLSWRMACPHNMCFLLGLLPFLLFQFVAIKVNVTLPLTVHITQN